MWVGKRYVILEHFNHEIAHADLYQCDVNRIFAYVRAGGTRKKADFDDLAHQIQGAWDRIISSAEGGSREKVLNRVFVMDAITAGMESGFALPRVSIYDLYVRLVLSQVN